MSTKLSFKEALERQGAAKERLPARSASPTHSVVLLAAAPISRPVDFIRLLSEHGISLKRARLIVDRLASRELVPAELSTSDLSAFFSNAHELNVLAMELDSPDINPKSIRDKQGLSQPEFASLYGLEPDTLKNWEQGRYAPDGPARTLLMVIEKCPHAVISARAKYILGSDDLRKVRETLQRFDARHRANPDDNEDLCAPFGVPRVQEEKMPSWIMTDKNRADAND